MQTIPNRRALSGFTLTELMITLAVSAVLMTAAAPSFVTTIQNNRLSTQANTLISSMQLARSEAVARNQRITLCRSSNGTSCAANGDWQQGWLIFADTNANSTVDAGEEIIRIQDALSGNTSFSASTDLSSYISYVASGASQLNDGSIQQGNIAICDDRGFQSEARAINLSATGRPRAGRASALGVATCNL